jgi:Prp8 binding protein
MLYRRYKGKCTKKICADRGIIDALDQTIAGGAGIELIATASDDGTVRVWEGGDEGRENSVSVS